jgi:cytochrome c oxidase subunit 2
VRRVAIAILVTSATVLAAAAVAYADNGGLTPPDAHSPNAGRINDAYDVVAVFTGFIFLLVEGSLVVFVVKYRRGRRAHTAEGPQIHGSGRLEVIWTVLPVFILAAIGVFVLYKLPGIKDVPKASAADKTTVTIEGHQFYWLFRYSNGAVAIDKMRAPAGRVVVEKITSPENDVIHSWWVPKLGGKQDAIPGETHTTWFKTNDVGRYEYRCAELCGIQHGLMNGYVEVVPKDEFDSWVSERADNAASATVGREEWEGVCLKCHRLDERLVGPALRGNPLLADRAGIETLVRNGRGQMPAVGSTWSDDQIDALVAYTKRYASSGGSSGG